MNLLVLLDGIQVDRSKGPNGPLQVLEGFLCLGQIFQWLGLALGLFKTALIILCQTEQETAQFVGSLLTIGFQLGLTADKVVIFQAGLLQATFQVLKLAINIF